MKVDLTKAVGTVIHLRRGEWYGPTGEPASEAILLHVVAVDTEMVGGLVSAHGHDCNPHAPDCGRDHCWEGKLVPSAVREELDFLP
ncbi:hypothetical protein QQG74_09505 [Micromonospora sp. FIMYZ51]|uniref:hypothetical protein n=1 Tax=Micromonospora sp. FIMYZ51 TaxID=3051832 RepID=UPI00311D4FC5